MNLIWNFPASGHSTINGLNSNGFDQFKDDPYACLGRETIQNSLDARIDNKGKAIVEYHMFKTSIKAFPGLESLKETLKCIANELNNGENTNIEEKDFANSACAYFEKNKDITWLRISDFNTKGLTGIEHPEKESTNYNSFIKGCGKNQKDENSGGSKGLGKNAIFVNSGIQTLLASSRTIDGFTGSIGVAKLLSFKINEGKKNEDYTQGIGFCVKDSLINKKLNVPFKELLNIDKEFKRENNQTGTDIYIPCFKANNNWKSQLIGEIISSFMPSLINNELEVRFVEDGLLGPIVINSESLEKQIKCASNFKSKKMQKEILSIYDAITFGEIITNIGCKKGFELEMYLHEDSTLDATKAFCYRFPTKMLIETREYTNTSKLCSAVVYVKGKELARRLRTIEDATHKKWSINRAGQYKESAQEALKILNTFIENNLTIDIENNQCDELEFNWGLKNGWICTDESGSFSGQSQSDSGLPTDAIKYYLRDDPTTHKSRKRLLKQKANIVNEDSDVDSWKEGEASIYDDGLFDVSHPEGQNETDSSKVHLGENEEKGRNDEDSHKMMVKTPVEVAECAMPSINPEEGEFMLYFLPKRSGENVEIEINTMSNEGDTDNVSILSAKLDNEILEIKNNRILMSSIRKNTKYVFRLHLDVKENYFWGVNVYAEE